ncbi:S41 family peptidase (plasmid) [Agrobacterium vitis]|uniref:S41 family peptidase n=1 Tax=Agrobacterium vitis TaxID=373 RepID=UPI003D26A12F
MAKLLNLFLFALLVSLSFAVRAQAAAFAKTDTEFWQEAGVDLNFLTGDDYLSGPNCMSTVENFKACMAAVNNLGQKAKPAVQVIPKAHIGTSLSNADRLVYDLKNGLVITTIKPEQTSEITPTRLMQASRLRRKWSDVALSEFYFQQTLDKAPPLDFRGLVKSSFAYLKLTPDQQTMAIADAVNAYVEGLYGPHGAIKPTALWDDRYRNYGRSLVGIGAEVKKVEGYLFVIRPYEGSPAELAGLRRNDLIEKVDDFSVADLTLEAAVALLRGQAGTVAKVSLLRDGKPTLISITRGAIKIENVQVTKLKVFGNEILHIRLGSFEDIQSCDKIYNQMKATRTANTKGLVLDLRDNGGGEVSKALCVTSLFIGRETVFFEENLKTHQRQKLNAQNEQKTDLPLVVLVNGNSASASEIVAGSLQDHKRAWVVGELTSGKGTMQQGDTIGNLKLFHTVGRTILPSGRSVMGLGLIPDFAAPIRPGATEAEQFYLREKDLYPEFEPMTEVPWTSERPDDLARMAECRLNSGLAEKVYKRDSSIDYPLAVASEVLACGIALGVR